mmetsp:Transcript_32071/g.48372  ORF Transcript_32071/g.48372 Transcript_32071/m.48372 type:complete len:92 (+) Transcript_32071:90-365(+)|eukprot:CAMPEP_0194746550 /NCGR_PEP_ID=MMETSP0323_2-20130528/502_1 /TAXON_ID=2866 ORGANISM="Crypthecodinium cohnii, Strain Seligo" /NCGR_SAMPLE_ID=MMETSP0323_2 /ASSEMBLY_ACC=CAM_ASM_000346 /LENGTH=91 /DNA_ID=CAMNT_0039659085 /DNA_START=77 /DNA_END=352 /DNA_ORIENTATION=-
MAGMGMPGIEGLSSRDQHAVMTHLNEMTLNENMTMYNNLVERCFGECITSFRSKTLDKPEEDCIKRCVQKYMSFSSRVAQRFQEKQQQMAK